MRDLFDDLEHEARQRSEDLERDGCVPAGFTAKHYPIPPAAQADLKRHKIALLLAQDPDTFVALAHEGKAPRRWVTRRLTELGYR